MQSKISESISCALKHVMWQRVFLGASEFKVRNFIQWTGHFAMYVRWLFGWRYISSLHSADEPQEGRNSCPLLRSCFIGSYHVGVSERFSRSISLAVYCLSTRLLVLRFVTFLHLTFSFRSLYRPFCCFNRVYIGHFVLRYKKKCKVSRAVN